MPCFIDAHARAVAAAFRDFSCAAADLDVARLAAAVDSAGGSARVALDEHHRMGYTETNACI